MFRSIGSPRLMGITVLSGAFTTLPELFMHNGNSILCRFCLRHPRSPRPSTLGERFCRRGEESEGICMLTAR